jgi:diguanylate cyclase (GGDEF)-like protein/PAS domain S-box-containing protein
VDRIARTTESVEDLARRTALQHVFDVLGVGVGIAVETGALIEVNEALLTVLGVGRQDALGSTLEVLMDSKQPVSSDDEPSGWREHAFTRPDGRRCWIRVSGNDVLAPDGRVLLRVYAVEDITMLKAMEELLRERALLDPVTGLPNRYLLQDRIQHALARRCPDGSELAVLFIDLDGFKTVNDTAGHRAGDLVLQEAGRRIAACARAGDTVARWAGDEFVMLCDVGGASDADLIALRVAHACAQPFEVNGQAFRLGASVGVGLSGAEPLDAERLLEVADRAMYADKVANRTSGHRVPTQETGLPGLS